MTRLEARTQAELDAALAKAGPGDIVVCIGWDPEPECGGGLHFSPRPIKARSFAPDATRYVARILLGVGQPVDDESLVPLPWADAPAALA